MPRPPTAVADVRTAVRRALTATSRPRGNLVLVACSGGADSLALAAAAAFVAPRLGLATGAVTVDHGLFDGSAAHAVTVAETLRALGLAPVEVLTVTVGTAGGPEGAARTARYTALGDAADRLGAAMVLLGHSRDDQAETVLLGLARGSGARSLAAMAPRSGPAGRWVRPLLDLPRATLERACAELGLEPWSDPANTDPAFARVRVRTRVLPVLEAELGPGMAIALARTAALLRADADALDAWAAKTYDEIAGPGGTVDVTDLAPLPAAVRTRVLRAAAIAAGSPPGELRASHVRDLDALVTDWRGQGPVDLPGHVVAARDTGVVRLGPRRRQHVGPNTEPGLAATNRPPMES